jgi:hypothetical protein
VPGKRKGICRDILQGNSYDIHNFYREAIYNERENFGSD